jgi:hypothetical protein
MPFDVSDKMTWWQATSVAGPAAAALSGTGMLIAWRGNQNSRNINVAVLETAAGGRFAGSMLRTTTLTDTSDYAPALSFYDNQPWLAWTGTNGAHTVNAGQLAVGTGGAISVTSRAFVNGGALGNGAKSGPTLSPNPYFDELSLHALATSGQMTDSSSSPAGKPWTTGTFPYATGALGAMNAAPDGNGDFYNAWTGSDGHITVEVPAPGAPLLMRSEQTSAYPPALARFLGRTYIAWTRPDTHLGLGEVLPTGSSDPITSVIQYLESSIAGPALVVRPGTNPPELAILWTGTDGTGALNAGVIQQA